MKKLGIFHLVVNPVTPNSTPAGIHSVGVDEFEAPPGETIRVTIEAVKTPYIASFGDLPPSTHWTIIQNPSPAQPVEIREFTMPNEDMHFEILYRFPQDPQQGAHYTRTIADGGQADGPFDVNPIPFFQTVTLSYIFHPA